MSKMKISFSFLLSLLLVGMFSAVAFAAGSSSDRNAPTLSPVSGVANNAQTLQEDLTTNDTQLDNGKDNSNGTGIGAGGQAANHDAVVKNVTDQKTHGEYMNNTNSCASCHQTHTGASPGLLFKNGEYATCTACHDGTLGFLNVFTASSAGTFGGTHDGNMSAHMANGTVQLTAAPGGNRTPSADPADEEGNWNAEFTCASCHAPHGSYSDRLLHENPNDMGNLPEEKGGKKVEGASVVDSLPTADATSPEYLVLRTTLTAAASASYPDATVGPTYLAKNLKANDIVLQLYSKQETHLSTGNTYAYKAEKDPWLHGYEFDDAHIKHYWTAFKGADGYEAINTDNLKAGEVLGNGFIAYRISAADKDIAFKYITTGTNTATVTKKTSAWIAGLTTGNIARAYVVDLAYNSTTHQTNDAILWSGGANAGKGTAASSWCSACHTDYLAKSATTLAEEGTTPPEGGTGTYSHAYRHNTTSDTYTCLRCHYAHGTDVSVMVDAQGKNMQQIIDDPTYFTSTPKGATQAELDARTTVVKDYLTDKNTSSALKRYTNMSVCWGCHTSSHSEGTRNTKSYEFGSGAGETYDGNGLNY